MHGRPVRMADSEAGLAAGGEVTVKACGVGVAMLPGQSWAPTWSIVARGTWEPSRVVPAARDPPGGGIGASSAEGAGGAEAP